MYLLYLSNQSTRGTMKRGPSWFAAILIACSLTLTLKVNAQTIGNEYYVSPSGSSSGNGSISAPWDLRTALNAPATVKPGDTIWLRGGSYSLGYTQSTIVRLRGAVDKPITLRGFSGERAIIDGTLHNE